MPVTSWSFSAWEVFERCRFQYQCKYIAKIKPSVPTPDYFLKGRRVHEGLAIFISTPGPGILPFEVQKELEFVNQLATWPAPKVVEQKWGFSPSWAPADWKSAWYRGICDVAIDYGEAGEVVDWKTGKRWASNDEQMECFATMSLHRYPRWESVTTRLVYVEKGGQEICDVSRADLPALTEKWNGRAREIFSERDFMPRPGEYCSRCDFSKANNGPCRYGGV